MYETVGFAFLLTIRYVGVCWQEAGGSCEWVAADKRWNMSSEDLWNGHVVCR